MNSNRPTELPLSTERPAPTVSGPASFRDRFCTASQCAPHEFADRVFLLALPFHALLLAPLLWPWRRRLFAADFALIEQVAGARWRGDVQGKLDRMHTPEWLGGPARRLLRWRISTQRLGRLMGQVMGNSERAAAGLQEILHQPPSVPSAAQNPATP